MGDILLIMLVLFCVVAYRVGYVRGLKRAVCIIQESPKEPPICDAVRRNIISSEYLAAMGAADFPDNDVTLEDDQTPEEYLKARGLS